MNVIEFKKGLNKIGFKLTEKLVGNIRNIKDNNDKTTSIYLKNDKFIVQKIQGQDNQILIHQRLEDYKINRSDENIFKIKYNDNTIEFVNFEN